MLRQTLQSRTNHNSTERTSTPDKHTFTWDGLSPVEKLCWSWKTWTLVHERITCNTKRCDLLVSRPSLDLSPRFLDCSLLVSCSVSAETSLHVSSASKQPPFSFLTNQTTVLCSTNNSYAPWNFPLVSDVAPQLTDRYISVVSAVCDVFNCNPSHVQFSVSWGGEGGTHWTRVVKYFLNCM